MTVQRHEPPPAPRIERTFSAVRAALPAGERAGFDDELEAITHETVVDVAKLDEFLSGWWRIATRAAADPAEMDPPLRAAGCTEEAGGGY